LQGQDTQTLLITGSAGGIGTAVAELGGATGARLALLDVDADRLAALGESLRERAGAEVRTFLCDVADETSVAEAVDGAVAALGAPTGVVTAAAIDRGGAAHELSPETWDQVLAINLRGTFLVCRAAIAAIRAAGGGGAIVCVSSPLAFAATPGSGAYAASKGGISALVNSLAVDYAGDGIRVNALLPGPTETKLMWASIDDAEVPRMREVIAGEVPLGRLADPAEVARAALWLLSDDASYITGGQLPCDGGVMAKASVSL
jgi:NAD(P)-dependent dehydrogenase (short-subunit alcohol dehydrogenase family)